MWVARTPAAAGTNHCRDRCCENGYSASANRLIRTLGKKRSMGFTAAVIFYGLADHSVEEVIDFYASREEAEEMLKQILEDGPRWAGMLEVMAVEFWFRLRDLTHGRNSSRSVVHSAHAGLCAVRNGESREREVLQ